MTHFKTSVIIVRTQNGYYVVFLYIHIIVVWVRILGSEFFINYLNCTKKLYKILT